MIEERESAFINDSDESPVRRNLFMFFLILFIMTQFENRHELFLKASLWYLLYILQLKTMFPKVSHCFQPKYRTKHNYQRTTSEIIYGIFKWCPFIFRHFCSRKGRTIRVKHLQRVLCFLLWALPFECVCVLCTYYSRHMLRHNLLTLSICRKDTNWRPEI